MQTASSHLPALMHRGGTFTTPQGRQLQQQNLPICNRKLLSGMTFQCRNLNDTKAQPFPTPPYQLSFDISEERKNLYPLSPPKVQPSGCSEHIRGQGITPGWNWPPQGIERCLWQEAAHCSASNSCCLQLFTSFSTPLPINRELREASELVTGWFCGVPHQAFCTRSSH